ncbi:MAG TPA: CPBP family intramembrane glutamic endopeptidase [Caulobacteraceae bacterium]|jgi:membrane protease YdiL (CAAX protease family)|nr:CPBP family intramembrane glutamic endopeptidase [Caulobacteraceae bacterium]
MDFIKRHSGGLIGLALYGIVWAASVAVLLARGAEGASDSLAVMAIFGIALPAVGWLVTLGERAPAIEVRRPVVELTAVIAFLVLYAVFFTGWGLSAFKAASPPGQAHDAMLLAIKLIVHVALPAGLIIALGGRLRPLFTARADTRGFWLSLVILGAAVLAVLSVISPSLKQIAGLEFSPAMTGIAIGGAFIWLAVEAGLCEEFLFRAVLQTRLAAVLKSELAAVFLGAVLFALAHVPGLWLRSGADVIGHSPSVIEVIAYAVAVLSPAGVLMGVMWLRTRSLLLVVLLHALIDVLPNTAEFARTWTG